MTTVLKVLSALLGALFAAVGLTLLVAPWSRRFAHPPALWVVVPSTLIMQRWNIQGFVLLITIGIASCNGAAPTNPSHSDAAK